MKAKVTIHKINGPEMRESSQDGLRFVGGTMGQSYAIKVENLTGGRILAVITVDGRNVVDSTPGDHAGNGYVLNARSSYSCEGWRTSNSSVAEFTLTTSRASYSSETLGDASNIGVIGVAVFSEKHRRPAASPRPASLGNEWLGTKSILRGSVGTGFGDDRTSNVTEVEFERDGSPELHVIRYDTIDSLVERGIMSPSKIVGGPRPFPSSEPAFCPRPA